MRIKENKADEKFVSYQRENKDSNWFHLVFIILFFSTVIVSIYISIMN